MWQSYRVDRSNWWLSLPSWSYLRLSRNFNHSFCGLYLVEQGSFTSFECLFMWLLFQRWDHYVIMGCGGRLLIAWLLRGRVEEKMSFNFFWLEGSSKSFVNEKFIHRPLKECWISWKHLLRPVTLNNRGCLRKSFSIDASMNEQSCCVSLYTNLFLLLCLSRHSILSHMQGGCCRQCL